MAGDEALDVLGDGNRRMIVQILGNRDCSVQELADALPISRPAVSRHLRLLKQAGLVIDREEGTKNIYHLRAEAYAEVQAALTELWGNAAARFRIVAENTEGPSDG
ncbi:MAG: metalloregulator ArsR/SmtB family transcription factor [Acidimicrobiia bacterium]|nr:metalloregulator ArsR/SmtB family transcription factor [Acidimicrobiia bacterium]